METSSMPVANPVTPMSSTTVVSEKPKNKTLMILIILLLLAIALVLGYLAWNSVNSANTTPITTTSNSTTTTNDSTNSADQNPSTPDSNEDDTQLETYTIIPKYPTFSLQYDSNEWTLAEEPQTQDPTVNATFTNKSNPNTTFDLAVTAAPTSIIEGHMAYYCAEKEDSVILSAGAPAGTSVDGSTNYKNGLVRLKQSNGEYIYGSTYFTVSNFSTETETINNGYCTDVYGTASVDLNGESSFAILTVPANSQVTTSDLSAIDEIAATVTF